MEFDKFDQLKLNFQFLELYSMHHTDKIQDLCFIYGGILFHFKADFFLLYLLIDRIEDNLWLVRKVISSSRNSGIREIESHRNFSIQIEFENCVYPSKGLTFRAKLKLARSQFGRKIVVCSTRRILFHFFFPILERILGQKFQRNFNIVPLYSTNTRTLLLWSDEDRNNSYRNEWSSSKLLLAI